MRGFGPVFELSSLNGTNGFQINGEAADDRSGYSVASAGDVNGDGFDDLIIGAIGADPNGSYSGATYVVFGKSGVFSENENLSQLNGTNGFQINGAASGNRIGNSVATAGDVNGDGFDDLIIGASWQDGYGTVTGNSSYLVFGAESGFGTDIDLATLNGTNGFKINGESPQDFFGVSVSSAGDINDDGYDDFIIGAPRASNPGTLTGSAYIVFGKSSGFSLNFEMSTLNGSNGFEIIGEAAFNDTGGSVASAGDFNGDGIDDLIIGAHMASPNGNFSGASYVVFGKTSGFGADLNLSTLNGANGFQINGEAIDDRAGVSVSSAGDVNGDGYDDLIIGAYRADPNGSNSGASYVVFGAAGGFAANLNLSALNGSNGFQINGETLFDNAGQFVASAGDVNGDGYDDLIIGTSNRTGSYVVFGKAGGFTSELNLSNLNGTNGFRIESEIASFGSFSSAGDINGDGLDDIIIGYGSANPNGENSGASFVIFGDATWGKEINATLRYSIAGSTATEGGLLSFTVTREGDLSAASSVRVVLAGDAVLPAATLGADLPMQSIYLVTFRPNEQTTTITIPTTPDGITEGIEVLTARLVLTEVNAVLGNSEARLVIRDVAQASTLQEGNFIMELQGQSWAQTGAAQTGSGAMLIRHVDGPTGLVYILALSQGNYSVTGETLTVTGASLSIGSPSGGAQLSSAVNFTVNLNSGDITWGVNLGFNYTAPGMNFAVNVGTAQARTWATLQEDGLAIRNENFSLTSWLKNINLPPSIVLAASPTLRFNSDGAFIDMNTSLSALGPYQVKFLDKFTATASGLNLEYQDIGRAGLADDVLKLQGRFTLDVVNLGRLSLDIGGPADREGLGGSDDRAILISDFDDDGDFETRVSLTVDIENGRPDLPYSQALKVGAFRFDSASLTFDNLDGTLDVSGHGQMRLFDTTVRADFAMVTVSDAAGDRLRLDAASIAISHPTGVQITSGIFLNSAQLSASGLTSNSVTFAGGAGGYWIRSSVLEFSGQLAVTSTTTQSTGAVNYTFKVTGQMGLINIGNADSLIDIDGSLVVDTAQRSVRASGEVDFGFAQFTASITGHYSERAWSITVEGGANISVGLAALNAFLERNGEGTPLNANFSLSAAIEFEGHLQGSNNGPMTGWVSLSFDTALLDFTLKYTIGGDWEIKPGVQIPLGAGRANQALATQGENAVASPQAYSVSSAADQLILQATWDNPVSDVTIEVIAPNGQVITEADFARFGITVVDFLSTDTAVTLVVTNPAAGNWDFRIVGPEGLGTVDYSAFVDLENARIVSANLGAITADTAVLRYNVDLQNNDEAVLNIYAVSGTRPVTGLGASAVLLGTVTIDASGAGSFNLSLAGLRSGDFRIVTQLVVPGVAGALKDAGRTIKVEAAADVAISFGSSEALALVGDAQEIALTLTNTGKRAANDIRLDLGGGAAGLVTAIIVNGQSVDPATFRLSSLAAGSTQTVTLVLAPSARASTESLTVVAATSSFEADLQDNAARIDIAVRDPLFSQTGDDTAQSMSVASFNGALRGMGGDDTLLGNDDDDLLFGGNNADSLTGGDGKDHLDGGDGNDRAFGGSDRDTVLGGAGLDTIYGGDQDDSLLGGSDADQLFGELGQDTLNGGLGRDIIVGGTGADQLIGGFDRDTFRFVDMADMSASPALTDVILDFARGQDKIDLSLIDASESLGRNNKFTFDGLAQHGTSPEGDVYFKQVNLAGTANDHTLIFLDTDADKASEGVIKVMGLHNFTAGDFIL